MNHPVLLPKRKDFGFLKAPVVKSNFKSSTSLSRYTPGKRQEFITETTKPITLTQSITTLKLKYELKSATILRPNVFESNSQHFKPDQNNIKIDLKKDHLDRNAYLSTTGTNFKNLKKQHRIVNIYSINSRKPKTADALRRHGLMKSLRQIQDNEEEKYCKGDCISCKFGKCLKLDQYVTFRGIKKPIDASVEYERTNTADSFRSVDFSTKTPNNRSTEFSEYFGKRSRKSGTFSDSPSKKTTDESFDPSIYQKYDDYNDDEEDDDIIPKLTLWLV